MGECGVEDLHHYYWHQVDLTDLASERVHLSLAYQVPQASWSWAYHLVPVGPGSWSVLPNPASRKEDTRMAGWGEHGCWAGAVGDTDGLAAWKKGDPEGPEDPVDRQGESFVGTAASWAPGVLQGGTGGLLDSLAAHMGVQGAHWVACGRALWGSHAAQREGLLPCVGAHQGDTQVHACCCCDYHSVHCQGGGASQRSPVHLRQETCAENEGGEAGWLLQTAAVQATPSSPPAAAVVVDAAGAASEAAAAAAAEEEGLASVHFPHGPSPPPPVCRFCRPPDPCGEGRRS